MDDEVAREQFGMWKQEPVTKWFFKKIMDELNEKVKYLGEGGALVRDSIEVTFANTCVTTGEMNALNFVLGIYPEENKTSVTKDKSYS